MGILIFKLIFMYLLIATFILVVLLFDERFKIGRVNMQTMEFKPCSNLFKMLFALLWIITIPIVIKNKNNIKE